MIQLPQRTLEPQIQSRLAVYQADVDSQADYAKQVARAKKQFSARNKAGNPVFDAVKKTEMCSGTRRCSYCEDSQADEVEHIKPKDWYPERAFVWENYLYACGPCNGRKSNKFTIYTRAGIQKALVRTKDKPIEAPEAGDPLLVDPRHENPQDFMWLDLLDTFYFLPLPTATVRQKERADYTIKLLGLNDRESLPTARGTSYIAYRSVLGDYIQRRDNGDSAQGLQHIINAQKRMEHRAVWLEMKRLRDRIPELKSLFDRAPEAMNW